MSISTAKMLRVGILRIRCQDPQRYYLTAHCPLNTSAAAAARTDTSEPSCSPDFAVSSMLLRLPLPSSTLAPEHPLLRLNLYSAPGLGETAGADAAGGIGVESSARGTLYGSALVGSESLGPEPLGRLLQGQRVTLTVPLLLPTPPTAAPTAATEGPDAAGAFDEAGGSQGVCKAGEALLELVLLEAARAGEGGGGGGGSSQSEALEMMARECLERQAALGRVASRADESAVRVELLTWRLLDAEKRCRSLTEDNTRLQQLLHAEQQAWRIPQLRMLVDSALLSREELVERCESVMAAYGRERARNGELVERLKLLHGEQVDTLELKKRYQQLQEAHEAQARAYSEAEEEGGRMAQLRATVKTQEEIIRNLEALLAQAFQKVKPRSQDAAAASLAPSASQHDPAQQEDGAAPCAALAPSASTSSTSKEAVAAAAAAAAVKELRTRLAAADQHVRQLEEELAGQRAEEDERRRQAATEAAAAAAAAEERAQTLEAEAAGAVARLAEAEEAIRRMERELEALRQHTVTEFPAAAAAPPPPSGSPAEKPGKKVGKNAAGEAKEDEEDGGGALQSGRPGSAPPGQVDRAAPLPEAEAGARPQSGELDGRLGKEGKEMGGEGLAQQPQQPGGGGGGRPRESGSEPSRPDERDAAGVQRPASAERRAGAGECERGDPGGDRAEDGDSQRPRRKEEDGMEGERVRQLQDRVQELEGELEAAREHIRELSEAAAGNEGAKENAAADLRRLQTELATVSEERTAAQLRAEFAEGTAEAAASELQEVTRRCAREIAALKTLLAEREALSMGGFGGLDLLAAGRAERPPFPAFPAPAPPALGEGASGPSGTGRLPGGAGTRLTPEPRSPALRPGSGAGVTAASAPPPQPRASIGVTPPPERRSSASVTAAELATGPASAAAAQAEAGDGSSPSGAAPSERRLGQRRSTGLLSRLQTVTQDLGGGRGALAPAAATMGQVSVGQAAAQPQGQGVSSRSTRGNPGAAEGGGVAAAAVVAAPAGGRPSATGGDKGEGEAAAASDPVAAAVGTRQPVWMKSRRGRVGGKSIRKGEEEAPAGGAG